MKALVTGTTGFVGSHLVEALQRSQVEVTALARSPEKAAVLQSRGIHVIAADLHHIDGLHVLNGSKQDDASTMKCVTDVMEMKILV